MSLLHMMRLTLPMSALDMMRQSQQHIKVGPGNNGIKCCMDVKTSFRATAKKSSQSDVP